MEQETRPALRKLKEERRRIDLIDQKLLALLNQRFGIALELGKVKRGMGKKIYDPVREREVLDNVNLKNKGPLKDQDLMKIFKTIIRVCRQGQT